MNKHKQEKQIYPATVFVVSLQSAAEHEIYPWRGLGARQKHVVTCCSLSHCHVYLSLSRFILGAA